MPRHHEHQLKSETKKSLLDLQLLQETRQAESEIKADLLEHNSVIKLHADQSSSTDGTITEAATTEASTGYIKQPEDAIRIARNSEKLFSDNAAKEKEAQTLDNGLTLLMEAQFDAAGIMKSWSELFFASTRLALSPFRVEVD
jgi:hypothetical protein